MRKTYLAALVAAGAMAAAHTATAQELKIGFISTFNHPLGKLMINGFKLGLKSEGWTKEGDRLGGVPTVVVYGDDQQKADIGRGVAEKMLQSDKVDIVAGIVWSNVLMAVQRPVVAARRILLVTNAGASPMFGRLCSPYFITTSWNGDQTAEATGKLMTDDKVATVYTLAPNYQAGKDVVAGMRRTFRGGKVVGQTLFKLGQRDFQAEIIRIRASRATAVFIFAPGPMGIGFLKQWAASGLQGKVRLYTVFIVDWMTLPVIGTQAVGSAHSMYWNTDLDNAANRAFVRDYVAAYGAMPAHYAAQAYDAPRLLAAALRATGGKFQDRLALMKAMRTAGYASVRGPYRYNVNGAPIQNFYRRDVVLKDGKPTIATNGIVLKDVVDSYWKWCPTGKRLN